MSNAQRQAAYRQRQLHDIDGRGERLNIVLDTTAKRTLERLASCYGVTQRVMLQNLLANAEQAALSRLLGLPDGPSQYYDRRLPVVLEFVTQ
ncbi:MAG: hypothetical protein ABJA49_04945 [Betaproteobacteria bacterium]